MRLCLANQYMFVDHLQDYISAKGRRRPALAARQFSYTLHMAQVHEPSSWDWLFYLKQNQPHVNTSKNTFRFTGTCATFRTAHKTLDGA